MAAILDQLIHIIDDNDLSVDDIDKIEANPHAIGLNRMWRENNLVSEEDLERHIAQNHPEQNPFAGMAEALSAQSLPIIASNLTESCLKHGKQPEEIVRLFYHIVGLLQDEIHPVSN